MFEKFLSLDERRFFYNLRTTGTIQSVLVSLNQKKTNSYVNQSVLGINIRRLWFRQFLRVDPSGL